MRYGFVVDNRRCIGCHACTVACKTENGVPLGVNRTWVKYVEKGRFPSTRRYFQVTRCNHCENPPCVAVCPVGGMFRRRDGIVDFDPDRCIGCRACMQACPYDAIHTDPERQTVAKCHFCAHRVDRGLEPACVVACPERAILAGDLDDPRSEIGELVGRVAVRARKPEQGTRPKLFYVDADEGTTLPTAPQYAPSYLWSERNTSVHGGGAVRLDPNPFRHPDLLAAYDVEHERPWGWQVPVYFWTKSVGAGMLLLPALAALLGWFTTGRWMGVGLSVAALGFVALTVLLLVSDLSRRERFWTVLARARWASWVSRGAWLLVAYAAACALQLAAGLLGLDAASAALLPCSALLGVGAAGYTAFLFGQCEGCDLWQSPLLPLHLVVQAAIAGAAALAVAALPAGDAGAVVESARLALAATLVLHGLAILGEVAIPHPTDNARYAARLLTHGPFARLFWGGGVALGVAVPAVLLAASGASAAVAAAGGCALAGLLAFEWCFVMAGQGVPNS